jgi:hypothetical protein
MTIKPEITIKPKATSYHLILVRLKKGSTKAVQSEVVAMPAKHTEAVETRADQKNKIQCNAIKNPVPSTFHIWGVGISKGFFLQKSKRATPSDAIKVL